MVAIKAIDSNKLLEKGKKRFVTEISLMQYLNHENVVKMIDFVWDSDNLYIILEYCNGGDLANFIKDRKNCSEQLCHTIMQQLSVGLQYLRSHNIAHLDLKPHNILLMKSSSSFILKIGGS